MSLRGRTIEHTATLPDGRNVVVHVGVPEDPYIPRAQLETVDVELHSGGHVLAAVNTVLDPDQESEAEQLARELGARATDWPARDAPELIVNATPLGQADEAAGLPLEAGLLDGRVVCDLAYRGDGAETGLIAAARERGARAVDGLDVLVGQGALAFRLFTGAEPPIEIMRAAVRNATIA